MARMTLEQIKVLRPKADRAKTASSSEEDIARHMREDGESPDAALGTLIMVRRDNQVESVASIRMRMQVGW